ncbi:MAG TPA: VWA domain-containing protein [Pyrinomonadaceae bacterium]|nr:VWA domain-containing protein [Pyrinomonadaceae bacterium]
MITTRILLSPLLLFSILLPVTGQQPNPRPSPEPPPAQKQNPPSVDEQDDVVRITTNLVQIDAVVTRDGKPVTDLKAEDFEIFEDGQPQAITNFSYVSNVPDTGVAPAKTAPKDKTAPPVPPAIVRPQEVRRTIALVVDELGMSFESINAVRKQLRAFIADLPPNDLVAVIRTGGEMGALQQFTTDRRVLENAINLVRWNRCSRVGADIFPRIGSMGLSTQLCSINSGRDTLNSLNFILRGMSYLPGRKSMVILSDSLPIQDQQLSQFEQSLGSSAGASDTTSQGDSTTTSPDSGVSYRAELQRVAELAIRASVVIYGVDTRGVQYTGITAADQVPTSSRPNPSQLNSIMSSRSNLLEAGREGAALMAKQTGGFMTRNSNDFGLKRVLDDQQGYYLIGFRPSEANFDGKFHKIKVQVRPNGLTVRTRAGFHGFTEEETRPPKLTAQDRLNSALLSPFGASEIPLRLTSFFVNEAAKGPLLRSFLHLNPNDLTFTEAGGRHVATFDLKGLLFGGEGRVRGQQIQTVGVRLSDASYEKAQRRGLIHSFDMPTKQTGSFQFRVAVRDVSSSRIGAAGNLVEIPNLQNGHLALSGIVVQNASNLTNGNAEATEPDAPLANSAWRQFKQGSTLVFAYAIYNATLGSDQSPRLMAQTRVFRDGNAIFTGNPEPVEVKSQTDLQRITATYALQLGAEMLPGQYIVQIIITDQAVKGKPRTATQSVDLEVVK